MTGPAPATPPAAADTHTRPPALLPVSVGLPENVLMAQAWPGRVPVDR